MMGNLLEQQRHRYLVYVQRTKPSKWKVDFSKGKMLLPSCTYNVIKSSVDYRRTECAHVCSRVLDQWLCFSPPINAVQSKCGKGIQKPMSQWRDGLEEGRDRWREAGWRDGLALRLPSSDGLSHVSCSQPNPNPNPNPREGGLSEIKQLARGRADPGPHHSPSNSQGFYHTWNQKTWPMAIAKE